MHPSAGARFLDILYTLTMNMVEPSSQEISEVILPIIHDTNVIYATLKSNAVAPRAIIESLDPKNTSPKFAPAIELRELREIGDLQWRLIPYFEKAISVIAAR